MRCIALVVAVLTTLAMPYGATAGELPVQGAVTSMIGWRTDPFGSGKSVYHRGIDIAVPEGTLVRATDAGTVMYAGVHGGHGLTIIVSHGDGRQTLYGHNSRLLVAKGEKIGRETAVALSGNSGRSTGPHVHYEVRGAGATLDAPILRAAVKESVREPAVRMAASDQKMLEIGKDLQKNIYSFRPVSSQTSAIDSPKSKEPT